MRSEDVIRAYYAGEYQLPYDAMCAIMGKPGWWSQDGDVHVIWADLELRVTHDGRRALELLDKARELACSQDAYYFTKRGEVLWEMGDRSQAVQCFERSAALSPDLLHRMHFAWALSSLEDPRAFDIWKRIVRESPDNCRAQAYFGREALRSGDREEALRRAEKADSLQSLPTDACDVAALYHDLDRFETAIARYEQALRLGYEPPGIPLAGIADCLFALGRIAAARDYAERAIQDLPEDDYVKETWQQCRSATRDTNL